MVTLQQEQKVSAARGRRRGQATIEMAVALIAVRTLFLGTFKVFLWFSERMVRRDNRYTVTRDEAGGKSDKSGHFVPGDTRWAEPPKMNLFKEKN